MSQQPGHPEENGQYGYDRVPTPATGSRRTPRQGYDQRQGGYDQRRARGLRPAGLPASRATASSGYGQQGGYRQQGYGQPGLRPAGLRPAAATASRATASGQPRLRPAGLRPAAAGLRPAGLRPAGLRAARLRPAGLRPGLRPAGLRPAGYGQQYDQGYDGGYDQHQQGYGQQPATASSRAAGRRLPAAAHGHASAWTTAPAAATSSPRAPTSSAAGRTPPSACPTPVCPAATWRSAGTVSGHADGPRVDQRHHRQRQPGADLAAQRRRRDPGRALQPGLPHPVDGVRSTGGTEFAATCRSWCCS